MNKVEKVFWKILLQKVTFNDKLVPVLVQSPPPKDITPIITVSSSGTGEASKRYVECDWLPLDLSHPLFDKDNPDKLYPQDVMKQKRKMKVVINSWNNTEKQRNTINTQIEQLLNECINFNYRFCLNYDTTTHKCKTLGSQCTAINSISSRGVKHMCPSPEENNYRNIITENNILPYSISMELPSNNDELNKKPIILHSIFTIDLIFIYTYMIGGNPTNDFTLE